MVGLSFREQLTDSGCTPRADSRAFRRSTSCTTRRTPLANSADAYKGRSRVKGEVLVVASGVPVSHASARPRSSAMAVRTCCKRVLASLR